MLKLVDVKNRETAMTIVADFNNGSVARKLDRPHLRKYLRAVGLREIDFRGNLVLAAFHLGVAIGSIMKSIETPVEQVKRSVGRPRKADNVV